MLFLVIFCKTWFRVRCIGIEVEDASAALMLVSPMVDNLSKMDRQIQMPPTWLCYLAEVKAYGDVVLQFVFKVLGLQNVFLPQYHPAPLGKGVPLDYGIRRLDHCRKCLL